MLAVKVHLRVSGLAARKPLGRPETRVQFRDSRRGADAANTTFDVIPKETNLKPHIEHPLLEKAEHDLERYCKNLEDDEEKERCWRVHKYLQNQHEHFTDGCQRELDEGHPGQSCQSLSKLEDMVRQVEGTKADLIKTISVMEKLNTRPKDTPQSSPLLSQDALETMEMQAQNEELKQKALYLFHKVDKNHDGRLDVAEFRDCMKLLSHELAGDDVMQIFTCLDTHGFITEDEFVDVVLAEKERLEHPDCDAELLRHLHTHAAWWSERPASVDSL